MGGMIGVTFQKVKSDFTILLWLSISLNDNLNMGVYTEECINIRRNLAMTKAITGEQRELVSSVAYCIPKFHGMTHYPHLIKKFGTPINFFGGFLESFLKEKLKRPSKRVNGHTHRLQHDILLRSYEGRQYSLARKVLFPSEYVMSLLAGKG